MQGPKNHKCVRDDKASQIAASKDCLEGAIDFTNDMIFYKFLISIIINNFILMFLFFLSIF